MGHSVMGPRPHRQVAARRRSCSMIGPTEPSALPRPPVPAAERCLLVAAGGPVGASLLETLRRQRARAERRGARYEVVVLVTYGQPLVACLALGDPLSGWVLVDEAASLAWREAGREPAERRLADLLWLLWGMEIPARGQVVDRSLIADRLDVARAAYDGVVLLRPASLAARWRQRGWRRRLRRLAAPVARVDGP